MSIKNDVWGDEKIRGGFHRRMALIKSYTLYMYVAKHDLECKEILFLKTGDFIVGQVSAEGARGCDILISLVCTLSIKMEFKLQ